MLNTKKIAATKTPGTAPTTANATPMPAPDALTVVPAYDKKAKVWETTICEGKVEHLVMKDTFETDDAAKAAGEAWLAEYAKANEAGRRKLLGWKPAKGGKTIGELASAMEKKARGTKADATADSAKPKAKREPKLKKESTRGPSGLDVAAQMLKAFGGPMKCKDMVEQMLAKGLWSTNGKTPAATIYAAIIREIAEKGKASRFTRVDRGSFAFNASGDKHA